MKQKFLHGFLLKHAALMLVLSLITLSLSSIADATNLRSSEEKSNQVSEFLKRLKEKDSLNQIDETKNQTKIKKLPESKPEVGKKRNLPTIKVKTKPEPKPVQINESVQTKQPTPRKKLSLDTLNKFYIRADYGMGWPQKVKTISFKESTMYGGGIGYKFNQALRADINFQFRELKAKQNLYIGKIYNSLILLNGYLILMDESNFIIPYLTAGMGYANTNPKFVNTSYLNRTGQTITNKAQGKTGKNITWNAGVGVMLKLTKNISLETNYRYMDFNRIKARTAMTINGVQVSENTINKRLHTHEVTGGLIFNF